MTTYAVTYTTTRNSRVEYTAYERAASAGAARSAAMARLGGRNRVVRVVEA